MTIEKAQLWLQKHSDTIPASRSNHQQIIELLLQENKSQDIISIAASDLGFSLDLLKKVNTNRGKQSGRDIVASTKSAITLLGEQVTHSLLEDFPVAESILQKTYQLFLFQQIISRSLHYEIQVTEWAAENGYPHIEQLKVCALLTYTGEALCCVNDFEHYLQYINGGSKEEDVKSYFGFSFSQLTEAVCQKHNLPEIIIESQEHNNNAGQKQKFLLFVAKLCHQCEHGWYTQKQQEIFQQFADFLQQPVEQVISKFHQHALLAARQNIVPDAWQAAARLILIQDKAWTPPPKPKTDPVSKSPPAPRHKEGINKPGATATESIKNVIKVEKETIDDDIFTRMKGLLKQQSVTQSDLLSSCINGLSKEFSLSKVSLLLLSKDKQKLQNRMSLGYQKEAPFRNYQVEASRAGLLKILLNKPQAIWINTSNFTKYEKIIPQSLLASIMTNDFFAMSLFVDEKPVGIIYADRSDTTEELDQQTFTDFKQLITLTSKALSYLVKKS